MKKLSVLICFFLLSTVLGTGVALFGAGRWGDRARSADSEELRAGFGTPETIAGRIVMVVPEENLVVLAVQTSSDQKAYVAEPNPYGPYGPYQERAVKIIRSGQTAFAFRLTASSSIRAGGELLGAADLESLTNKQATVRFVPRRAGNFVEWMEVSG